MTLSVALTLHFTDNGNTNSNLGSSAIIGIVVAAICILLLVIAIIIVFLICRIRREALKNSRARRACIDPSLLAPGFGLPVDIPIEALTREPPPQYTPRSDISASTSLSPNQFTISVLPPPYYSPGAASTVEMSYSYEAPPKYQSAADLNASPTGLHPKKEESSEPRRSSVDSFVGVPSMSNILLTSSRSSALGFESIPGDDRRPGQSPSQSDSARGESVTSSRSRRSIDCAASSSKSLDVGSRSRSLSNILSDSIEIPQHGLQKYIHDSQSTRTSACLPYRSVPALQCAEMTSDRTQDMTSRSPEASAANRKQKQRKYHKKRESQKAEVRADESDEQNPTSGTTSQQPDLCHTDRLMRSKKYFSRSLPQLATLPEDARWEEIGSCEV